MWYVFTAVLFFLLGHFWTDIWGWIKPHLPSWWPMWLGRN